MSFYFVLVSGLSLAVGSHEGLLTKRVGLAVMGVYGD